MARNVRLKLLIVAALLALSVGAQALIKGMKSMDSPRQAEAAEEETLNSAPWNAPANGGQPVVKATLAKDGVTLNAVLDRRAVLRKGDGRVHVQVDISTPEDSTGQRITPTDFVVVLDHSGSMRGDKLYYAKQALRQLIERLRPVDRFGLVTYESWARVRFPLAEASANQKQRWLSAVDAITAAGGTNMSGGLDLGTDLMGTSRRGRAGRMLLLSDGLANQGDPSLEGLTRRARRAVQGEFVLSTMGVGAQFDEQVMTALATAGTGAFYYLEKLEVLPTFLDGEFKTATETYAQGAQLTLELEPGVILKSAMGLPFTQHGRTATVTLGSLYVSHQRRIWLTLSVPTDELKDVTLGSVGLRYRRDDALKQVTGKALPAVSCVADWDTFKGGIHQHIWERAILEDALNHTEQQIGTAIVKGTAQDVDNLVQQANQHRRLAKELNSQSVQKRLDYVEAEAKTAKKAQTSSAPARARAAKRSVTRGYAKRNKSSYRHSDPMKGF